MKYQGMPMGMWLLFVHSFQKQLREVLHVSTADAKEITQSAKVTYRTIIQKLPGFEKGDRFQMNIVSCAMFSSFLLNMKKKPSLTEATEYYKASMMTRPMIWFCRKKGKKKYTAKDIEGMKQTAKLQAANRNPYSWNMEFHPYPDQSGYEARFTYCGICHLMKELKLEEYIPAMCALDYTMSDAGEVTNFVRQYTLAGGGPYCDCGYKKKGSAL